VPFSLAVDHLAVRSGGGHGLAVTQCYPDVGAGSQSCGCDLNVTTPQRSERAEGAPKLRDLGINIGMCGGCLLTHRSGGGGGGGVVLISGTRGGQVGGATSF